MKKKIIILIPTLNVGGAEKMCLDLALNLDKDRYEVYLISLSDSVPLLKNVENIYGFNYSSLGRPEKISAPWIHFKSLLRLVKIVKKIRPDIIHSHLWGVFCFYLYPFLFLNLKIKYVSTIHTPGIHYQSNRAIDKLILLIEIVIYKLLKFNIIAISNEIHELFRNKFFFKSVEIINNGIDTSRFKEYSKKEKQLLKKKYGLDTYFPILIYIAKGTPNKRQIDAIQSVIYLLNKFPKVMLLLIGKDNYLKYNSVVNQYDLTNNIRFYEFHNNPSDLINCADIGLFPSLYEGLSLSALEKLSCGLPTIFSDINSFRELTESGKLAPLVKVKDPLGISLTVERILKDDIIFEELKINARNLVVTKFSLTLMINKYENYYLHLI